MTAEASGRFVLDDGGFADLDDPDLDDGATLWYRIDDHDLLDPFLVTVVTPDDQWIYVSTSGALAAGRGSADRSLFPYETDDRLHRNGGTTGPVTIVRLPGGSCWEPFSPLTPIGAARRSLAKTTTGDRLRFAEYRPDLGLTFRYTWATAGPLGLIRRCELVLDDDRPPIEVELLDGLVDVLPAGVDLADQQAASTLVDAYRRSELDPTSGLGVFTLEALVSDKADPAESLTANVVWSIGLDRPTVALSDRQLRAVRSGRSLAPEHLVTGSQGRLPGVDHRDRAPGRAAAVDDRRRRRTRPRCSGSHRPPPRHPRGPGRDRTGGGAVGSSHHRPAHRHRGRSRRPAGDGGPQRHRAPLRQHPVQRHAGAGVFLDDHRVEVADVSRSVWQRNRLVGPRFDAAVADLDPVVTIDELRSEVGAAAAPGGGPGDRPGLDADLVRLVDEYLPLVFSRRHGDPSRPWNRFRIPSRTVDGPPAKGYEGKLARHLPELGRTDPQLPPLPRVGHLQVPQRVHARRPQPLPDHRRRHRLGNPGGGELGQLRVLGRPPDRLSPPAARRGRAVPPRAARLEAR